MTSKENAVGKPVALVTGASGGLGAAICLELLAKGFCVVGCDQKTHTDSRGKTGAYEFRKLNVGNAKACVRLIEYIEKKYARLDVLVNNAATWAFGAFISSTDQQWREVLETNVVSPARLCRLALPLLSKSRMPRIVMIGSKNGSRSEAGLSSYDVSKAAIEGLTRSLAVELARFKVLVNCVAPGVLLTSSNHGVLKDKKIRAGYLSRIPLRRFGETNEIARLVAFLSGPEIGFSTGSVFVADGGQLAGE